MKPSTEKLFLLDGMPLIYRAHFVFIRNPRLTSTGQNVSALYGYTNSLLQILEKERPTHIAVAFDTAEPTQRHREYPEYKAHREAMPEDIKSAIPHVIEITEAFNIPVLRCPGHEADDIIGTLARQADEQGIETYMVTPDKDVAQLVSDRVRLYKPGRGGGPTRRPPDRAHPRAPNGVNCAPGPARQARCDCSRAGQSGRTAIPAW